MAVVINGTSGITGNTGTLISASTIGVGGTTPSASGAGITFPASQSASTNANTLDDYEEGTWTPTWYGASTAGTPSGSASGTYTKIGNMVTVYASFSAINLTGATGDLYIGGLPFTQAVGGQGVCYFEGITPTYTKAIVSGAGLLANKVGTTMLALKPSITTAWDNYLSATSTFTGGGGSTYGQLTYVYFV